MLQHHIMHYKSHQLIYIIATSKTISKETHYLNHSYRFIRIIHLTQYLQTMYLTNKSSLKIMFKILKGKKLQELDYMTIQTSIKKQG